MVASGLRVANQHHVSLVKGCPVAKNTGRGSRVGAVKQRSQVLNPKTGKWTKRGPDGQFLDGKSDNHPFKGVTKEK